MIQPIQLQFNFLLFDGFETLDAFGPAEIFGHIETQTLRYFSLSGGLITSTQGVRVMTEAAEFMPPDGILVLPGGLGTRALVHDEGFIAALNHFAGLAQYCLTICTGSALLAKTGLLDGHRATSNKRAFEWATSVSSGPKWIRYARWTVDGKFYTSSGVSAGMDMALGFTSDLYGAETAENIANIIEYHWNRDPDEDAF